MNLHSNTIIKSDKEGIDGELKCRSCQTVLSDGTQEWKKSVKLDERPLEEVAGEAYSSTDQEVLYRQFFCPGCGGLLDSEIALQGEPYLQDNVWS